MALVVAEHRGEGADRVIAQSFGARLRFPAVEGNDAAADRPLDQRPISQIANDHLTRTQGRHHGRLLRPADQRAYRGASGPPARG